ncbi:MAG: hypothetical protein OHK93_006899 [Ramalina farinacea]|uniref:Pre-mRNA-splicing factor 18 n=1 Tax=Ramalina farinacea TaxID=258253 RepID=A0AA43QL52_9LECA|nr:hypothetical protein [Ramalina farinacea]
MDFAALLSAEISRNQAPTPPSSTSASPPPAKKYLSKADQEAAREKAYRDDLAAQRRAQEAKASAKRKRDEEDAARDREREEKRRRLAEESRRRREEQDAIDEARRRKRLGLPPLEDGKSKDRSADSQESQEIPEEELYTRLRSFNEPITLFGESASDRLHRYRRLQRALQSTLDEPKKYPGPIPTTIEPVPESDMKVPPTLPSTLEARQYIYRQLSSYFNLLFVEWSTTLAARSPDVKNSTSGRQASQTLTATITSLRPLIAKLETNTLEDSILRPLLEIVCGMQERRYVDANDGYLRLSIGKAAWPIGVTMVGIHERSAREKLHEGDVQGHIMSDEVTRKFLQGIKRCLSFAQTRWAPEDFGQVMG